MPSPNRQPDPTKEKVLYVVATSHLDTQWRWTYQDTINRYLPNTLRENFALFDKYPNYTFSFEGAIRYMFAKEHYPEDFERLKGYIANGQWAVCGSAVDAGDTNTVSPESLIRNTLYANKFFEREFGVTSRDVFLPDCFGFSWVLPSVAAHCGLLGFSTSKLEWGSSLGIPFDVGMWEGPDGSAIVATINPGQYSFGIKEEDLANDANWAERIEKTGKECGAYVGFKYFGLGDVGGAPDEESVKKLEEAMASDGSIRVLSAPADALHRTLTDEQKAALPRHKTEFLLIEHGVGTYTSHGAMKRWNRANEFLGDAAERFAAAAEWMGGNPYPAEKITQSWIRFLANQMHDILPGSSIPEAYRFAWNDEHVSLNRFREVLDDSLTTVASLLDTTAEGASIVVVNPCCFDREDVVEAAVDFGDGPAPKHVAVYDPDGNEVASQVIVRETSSLRVLFLAKVPSAGCVAYDVQPSGAPCTLDTRLRSERGTLENERYRVVVDKNGDVASIFDKKVGRDLLSEPSRLILLDHEPMEWPAWTIEYRHLAAEPVSKVRGPAELHLIENGPVRASIEIRREAEGSEFVQRVRLAAGGAGDRVEVETDILWNTGGRILKATFPMTPANENATYDLGLGTIERGNNHERRHEVPAQQWADLTAPDGSYGAAVLSDCKYGWDKPADDTLRLTLLHTPRLRGFHVLLGGANFTDWFSEQDALDFGRHRMAWAIAGHAGDWRSGDIPRRSERFNRPLVAFQTASHTGPLGKKTSFLSLDSGGVAIRATKKAEDSDEIVVRLQELHGAAHERVAVSFAGPVFEAREVNGAEEPLGPAMVENGELVTEMKAFQPRAFAIRLGKAPASASVPKCAFVELPYDLDAISSKENPMDGNMDGRGHSYPAELLPDTVVSEGISFRIGPKAYREDNAVVCRGQRLALPGDGFNRVAILAAAVGGDVECEFLVDERPYPVTVPDFSEPVGQWDSRVIDGSYVSDAADLIPGYRKRVPIAWVGTHRYSRASGRDEAYEYCYLFKIVLDVPPGARELVLPNKQRVRIFAVSTVKDARPPIKLDPMTVSLPAR